MSMVRTPAANVRRGGAVAAETAVVLMVVLVLMFGILEYCRFLMVRQICENAVREGARQAVVHTGDQTTTWVQQQVFNAMGGVHTQVKNHVNKNLNFSYDTTDNSDIQVYRVQTTAGTFLPKASQIEDASTSGNPRTFTPYVTWANGGATPAAPFTHAAFGDYIAVTIQCNYRPLFGKLLFINDPIPLTFTSVMRSESN